ncbi:MAG: hypothetical protein JXA90_16365 [Planctomycetes bacterium]|nr:hypothetical protein [Planctomycetota bacterium]
MPSLSSEVSHLLRRWRCPDQHRLLSLAVSGNIPEHEIEYPMEFVILGSLEAEALLDILFLPALYGRFARKRSTAKG